MYICSQIIIKQKDMNVQEFRVGNYIKDTFDIKNIEIRKLDLEDFSVMLNFQNSNNHAIPYNPIQLTEEILLKCGFEKTSESGYCGSDEEHKDIYSCGLVDIAFSDNNFYLWVSIDDDPYYSFCWTKIEYVHQLQNMVFAISGKELEINL